MTSLNRRQALRAAGIFTLAAGLAPAARAAGPVTFTITIRNIATDRTLRLPDGGTSGAPIAPGVYVVAPSPNVLFTPGDHADEALERLAEDGNFQPLLDKITAMKGLRASGMFVAGQPFTVTALPGDRLQFATMFVQSNDLFFAARDGGIALFDASGRATHGNVTRQIGLYDAGTEVNQAPGAGPDQAPRQAKPNTGTSERVPVTLVADRHDGFTYPPVDAVIEVEIVPAARSGEPQG